MDETGMIQLLRDKVMPALGCTEPVAVALAAARCRDLLGCLPQRLSLKVSGNLFKNGMGVGVPGTGLKGLAVAAAIGAVAGDASAGLEVLSPVRPHHLPVMRDLLGCVSLSLAEEGCPPLHAEVTAEAGLDSVRVVVSGGHTRIVREERNGKALLPRPIAAEESAQAAGKTSLAGIFQFIATVSLDKISFMSEAVRLNAALAEEGLSASHGLGLGAALAAQVEQGLLSDDLMTLAMRLSAAASDARMAGAALPAMSNSGSGNQGIAATLPVLAAARRVGASEERLIRAVTLSHLVAIHIKSQQNPLSALCAASTAGMGAGVAICWLLGGDLEAAERSVHNMVGDLSGIICDGAKGSCAMKVSTAASAAVKAALLANSGMRVGATDGIVAESAEDSIANLAALSKDGMAETDRQIIGIMLKKVS